MHQHSPEVPNSSEVPSEDWRNLDVNSPEHIKGWCDHFVALGRISPIEATKIMTLDSKEAVDVLELAGNSSLIITKTPDGHLERYVRSGQKRWIVARIEQVLNPKV